jgi:hypothetical protein
MLYTNMQNILQIENKSFRLQGNIFNLWLADGS